MKRRVIALLAAFCCLFVTVMPAKADTFNTVTPGTSQKAATLLADDGKDNVATVAGETTDWYSFTVPAGVSRYYTVYGKNNSVKNYVKFTIIDASGSNVDEESCWNDSDFTYNFKAAAGSVYYISANNNDKDVTGSYKLNISWKEDAVGDDLKSAQAIQPGNTVTGSIDGCDDKDFYTFTPTVSGWYQFYVKNLNLMQYIKFNLLSDLQEKQTDELSQWNNYNARKAVQLNAGATYYVSVGIDEGHSTTTTGNYKFFVSKLSIAKVKNLKLSSPSSGTYKAKWSKISGVDGYEVQCSNGKSFADAATNTVYSGSTRTYSGYVSGRNGKTVYVRVRAYVEIDGQRYYGKYSAKIKVKLKK